MALGLASNPLSMRRGSATRAAASRLPARPAAPRAACAADNAPTAPGPSAAAPARRSADALVHTPRRALLGLPLAAAALAAAAAAAPGAAVAAAEIEVLSDEPGSGAAEARAGDLLLVHYTGYIGDSSVVFDSTCGEGLTYRDGGPGALRPLALRLGGSPLPGICAGLQAAFSGMRVGGRRSVSVPPELAFGSQVAVAPYALVPPGSGVRYEVELLRLSRRGPDALFKGLSKCSQGGASATTENCAAIEPAEFL
ncbi:MAG: hypothetical protein J3K34DRAFT_11260 [Monoraphidium minutum]|nr:MAG: hypothetical protein J3K34DRAFT_11260 [Monoraphidium minutum]